MAYSERRIGFSTGALAKGDFRHALEVVRAYGLTAVELSALRDHELPKLIEELASLDLSNFTHISIHAPSKFSTISEEHACDLLWRAIEMKIGVVVHPDAIQIPSIWTPFGALLWIENLDKRKPVARTVEELQRVFKLFPESGFCLDVAHARQIDPTMSEAARMLCTFEGRLRQIHASGLNSDSTHSALSTGASSAFAQISYLIPADIPVILESPIPESAIVGELDYARNAFSPWFLRLRSDIDDVFNFQVPSVRRIQLESFLRTLTRTGTRLWDFQQVVAQLPTGSSYRPGEHFQSASQILELLSTEDKEDLQQYFRDTIARVVHDYPELAEQFKEQFSS
jgi:hypothetical protein